jgi:hypothetical protein
MNFRKHFFKLLRVKLLFKCYGVGNVHIAKVTIKEKYRYTTGTLH